MSFPTWPPDINNITDSVFKNTILDGQVDVSGTFYNRTGNVIIGDSSNPDFDPSSNGITLNTTRICLGKDSSVTGDNGVAIGNSATTGLQENSISIGYNCIVDASNSVAIGNGANASGTNSFAIGNNATTSTYTNSVAIGNGATASDNNEIKLGSVASFNGDSTKGMILGDVGIANETGLQHINLLKNGTNYALSQTSAGITRMGCVSGQSIVFFQGGNQRAYITNTLHINTAGISYDGTSQPTGGTNNQIGFRWKGSSAQVGVGVDNALGAYFAFLSDRRAKTNIVDYTDGLTGIMKLKPKQYEILKIDIANCDLTGDNCIIRDLSGNTIEYDSEGNCCDDTETYGELNTGLILDEVRPIFPQVCEGGDENSIGTINYAGLVPMLIKAVQQQQEQIEALKLEVEALKNP